MRKVWQQIRDAYEVDAHYKAINANCVVSFKQLFVYGNLAVVVYGKEVSIYKDALTKPDGKIGITAVNYVRAFLGLSNKQFGVRGGSLFVSDDLADIYKLV